MTRTILFIGTVFPEPTSSAAGSRTLALVRAFVDRGDSVHFASPSDRNAFAEGLRVIGVQTFRVGPNDPAFDAYVRSLSPEVVIFDRFMLEEQFGWRVEEAIPQAVRVLDTIDLHFLRRARASFLGEALKRSRSGEGGAISVDDLTELYSENPHAIDLETDDSLREIGSIYRSDLALILSPAETHLLTGRFGVPAQRLLTLGFSAPNPTPDSREAGEPALSGERAHFVSIGNFRHPPNRDSVFHLARVIWPRVRAQLFEAGEANPELHFLGAYVPKEIRALESKSAGIRVPGAVPDAVEALRRFRILLAPLRFGAGLKGKILDAWAAGTAVITTPIGAEGMGHGGSFAGKVAVNDDEFVSLAVETYRDIRAREDCARAGYRSLATLFDAEDARSRFLAAIDALLDPEALARNRAENRVGRLLRFDSNARTKYFSRWIEEKNRPRLLPEEPK